MEITINLNDEIERLKEKLETERQQAQNWTNQATQTFALLAHYEGLRQEKLNEEQTDDPGLHAVK